MPEERPLYRWIPERKRRIATLPDGREVLFIPLTNSADWTALYREDYYRLMQAGISPNWHLTDKQRRHRYVVCPTVPPRSGHYTRSGSTTVARLVVGAAYGEVVRYRDKNPLNLLLDNLRTT